MNDTLLWLAFCLNAACVVIVGLLLWGVAA